MSNIKHHGRISEVWKHLVIGECVALMRPDRYLETHAGSACYPVADDAERWFGVRYFRSEALADDVLANTQYYASLAARLEAKGIGFCPGSAVVAMDSQDKASRYVLCDTDPDSADTLRTAAERSRLSDRVDVVESDGMRSHGASSVATPPRVGVRWCSSTRSRRRPSDPAGSARFH